MSDSGGNWGGGGGGPGTGRNGKHPRGNRGGGGRGHNTRGRGGGGNRGGHGAAGSERKKAPEFGSVNSVDFPGLMDATNVGYQANRAAEGPSSAGVQRGNGNNRRFQRGQGQTRGAHRQQTTNNGENDKQKTASSGSGSEDDGNENNVPTRKFKKRERKFEGPVFGFKRLHKFLETESGEVLLSINRDKDDWKLLLESNDLIELKLILVIEVLAEKVCKEAPVLLQLQTNALTACCSEVFVNKLVDALPKICNGVYLPRRHFQNNEFPVDSTSPKVMNNIYQICNFMVTTLPSNAADFFQSLICIAMGVSMSPSVGDTKMELLNKFKTLNDQITDILAKKQKEKEQANRRKNFGFNEEDYQEFDSESPPDCIKDIEVIPSIQELLCFSEPFLRPNKRAGAYNDADHYLDVQFRLLREDFVRPLRNGVLTFRRDKHDYINGKKKMPLGEIRLYTDVTIDRVVKDRDTVVYKLQLSDPTESGQRKMKHPPTNYKKIKWERSKRLLVGSLIILTSGENCFQSDNTHFGIIYNRNFKELEKGILSVSWEGAPPQHANEDEEYIMFESEVYLEAYRHTLETLKSLELSNFPMKKFIVDACGTVELPKYLKEATKLIQLKLKNGDHIYLSPQQGQWPTADEFGLDDNQLSAFQAAITKEFSIIQGPPGTGKTFLGLKVAEVLLNNSELWESTQGNPITVVCYTNHALDQFLEGILAYYEREDVPAEIIRIGGRCKSESLAKFTLREVRSRNKRRLPQHYWAAERAAREAIYYLEEERANRMSEVTGLLDLQGIVDFERLSAWQIIQVEYPKQLWDTFQKLSWFEIGKEDMKRERFSEEEVAAKVRGWFQVRAFPKGVPKKVKKAPVLDADKVKRETVEEEEDFDEDDEEDFDLEELLEHRIVDDILMEAETSHQINMGKRIAYLPDSSIGGCDKSYKQINKAINDVTRGMTQDQVTKVRETKRAEQLILENRRKFLYEVFRLYKEQLLDLPDVTGILQEIRQNGPVLNHLPRLPMSERWALYFAIVDQVRHRTAEKVAETEKQLSQAQRELRQTIQWGDGLILQHCKVVGLTTTGAAKYNNLLKMMKSKIVIVEEAAEVFEAHIVTCITESCEQLILIGDHRQLRPSPTVYNLATKYHLDLSLFERMLNNKLHCHQLKMQHRMRPDISDLVVGPIYEELYNHDSVKLYPDVRGIPKNVFFITHTEKESADADSTSKSNKHEVKFISAMCRYLILQGYDPQQITVLTMYTGQMFLLKKEIGGLGTCKGIRVTCVDNFQGEENDIILLSLVRSNSEGNIGFLKIDNRICVSLSRAKHGLYVIGNMDGMVDKSKTWRAIKDKLDAQDAIGESLELQCQNHLTRTLVRNGEQFRERAPEGGCTLPCEAILACTHKCKMVCHIIDKDHEKHKCREKCLKVCANDLHPCRGACFEPCPLCMVRVEKTLKCELEHKVFLPCHRPVDGLVCREVVEKTLPCGHKESLACFVSIHDYACKVEVEKSLPCSHKRKMECHADPTMIKCKASVEHVLPCDHLQKDECWRHPETIKCQSMVQKKFDKCGHEMPVKCSEKNLPVVCKGKCNTRLPCGHQCVKICHVDDDPEHSLYLCKKDCGRECKDGHKCASRHHCSKKCPPCTEEILRMLPCGHQQKLPCHVDINAYECLQECQRLLTTDRLCRHKCPNLCFQPCGPCTAKVKKRAPCGHPQEVLCSELAKKEDCKELVPPRNRPTCGHTETFVECKDSEKPSEEVVKFCQAPCDHTFSPASSGGCGHPCKGTCSSCLQGRIHMKCQSACGRQLVCGHVCEVPCSAVCPPCQKPCMMKCEHSACKMKCGEPCSNCKEQCGWVCAHKKCTKLCGHMCDRGPCDEPCRKKLKCGHECVGFCGEPCPPLCRICNREELTTEFFLLGNEEEEDARFVYLEDCKHTIEVEGLEGWIAASADGDATAISAKSCPRCKTTIRNCRRFGNLIRQHYKDVVTVKMRAYGNKANTESLQKKWIERLSSDIQMERIFSQVHGQIRNYLVKEIPLRHGFKLEKRQISEFAMRSLDFVADSADKTANNLFQLKKDKLVGQHYNRVLDIYRKLFASIMERHPLSTQEVRDFNEELDRMDYFTQLMIRRSLSNCNPDNTRAYPKYEHAKKIVTSTLPFNAERRHLFKRLLGELDELLRSGLGITDRERIDILRAMGEAQGHWFKCPNGHIYVISDCGGAMVESRCGECNATIGGGSHRLRSDNALAGEMDGATSAAWPTALQ